MKQDNVSRHEQRSQIERDLALGVPLRRLEKKYGVSVSALHRHKKKLPPQYKNALLGEALKRGVDLEKLRTEESEGLLVGLAAQRAKLLLAQDAALEAEQFQLATHISAQIHRNLELVGKYLGEFAHQVTSVSVLVSPAYLELRSALLKALQPYPDARRAVADALHKIETDAARRPAEVQALPAPEVIDVGE
jgi:hypothetical protein